MPSSSCPGSRHYSRASPLTSFHGSWGETPATDEFLSGTAIGSPILLGDICGLTAVNSDPICAPGGSPNDRVYILVPAVDGLVSTDLSQPSHDLHVGGLRVVNPDPRTYLNQGLSSSSSSSSSLFSCSTSHRFFASSKSSFYLVVSPSTDIVSSPESSQEYTVIPSAQSLISLMPSKDQRHVPNGSKYSYLFAKRPNSTPNSSCSIDSHVCRSTYSEHPTSNLRDIQVPPTTICPPYPISEAERGTQGLASVLSNYWQFASSEIPPPVSLEIHLPDTPRCPPYPISEPESVISNLSPVPYPRPLFTSPRTSINVRRQTSEMFLIDAHIPNSRQVSQLTDTSNFGHAGVGVTGTSVSRGRLQTIASLEQLVDQERRDWASGSLSQLNMVSHTFPNHRSTWPWREFPGAGSFPLPSGLVAGLNAGQIAQDRRIWRNLFH